MLAVDMLEKRIIECLDEAIKKRAEYEEMNNYVILLDNYSRDILDESSVNAAVRQAVVDRVDSEAARLRSRHKDLFLASAMTGAFSAFEGLASHAYGISALGGLLLLGTAIVAFDYFTGLESPMFDERFAVRASGINKWNDALRNAKPGIERVLEAYSQ